MKKELLLIYLLFLLISCQNEDSIVLNPKDDVQDVFAVTRDGCRIKKIISTNSSGSGYREFNYNDWGGIESTTSGNNNYIRFYYNTEKRIDSVGYDDLKGHYLLIYWNGSLPSSKETYLADTLYSTTKYSFNEKNLLSSIELIRYYNKEGYSVRYNYYFDNNENMIGWRLNDMFYLNFVYLRYDGMRNFRKLLGFDFLISDLFSGAIQCFSKENPLYTDDIERQRKYTYQYNSRGYPVFIKEFGFEVTFMIEYENCD